MSFISFVVCAMDRHQPVRREVYWDGKHYATHCRHCGEAIIRTGRRKWRKRED